MVPEIHINVEKESMTFFLFKFLKECKLCEDIRELKTRYTSSIITQHGCSFTSPVIGGRQWLILKLYCRIINAEDIFK